MSDLNFIEVTDPRSVLGTSNNAHKIFLTGYSAAPEGYAEPTHKYVAGLVDSVTNQGKAVTLITSPTATGQSIDAIGTTVAHEKNAGLLYITGEGYLQYVDAEQLPPTADKARFVAEPKYYFKDNTDYSLASAVAADVLVVTGGRDTAVLDFMHSLQEGKQVILLDNPRIPTGFDTVKNRPHNAAEYITKMVQAVGDGQQPPYPAVKGLDEQFIKTNLDKIARLVSVDNVDAPLYLQSHPVVTPVVGGTAGARLTASNLAGAGQEHNDKI